MPNSVILGNSPWKSSTRGALEANGFTVIEFEDGAHLVARLADAGAALFVIGADVESWSRRVSALKSSPATRRIPVIVIGADAEAALLAGADATLSVGDIAQIGQIALDIARAPLPADSLAMQCDEPLPPLAQEAVRRFNAGEYYRQHDLFEELWMHEPRPIRTVYQGILQVGIAYHQIEEGNWRGAYKMILRAIGWLAPLPDRCQGIDIAALRADAAGVRAELERIGEANLAHFDHSLLRGVNYPVPGNEP